MKKLFLLAFLSCFFLMSKAQTLIYAIDCGGDGSGLYVKDNYFTGGGTWAWADAITTGVTDPAPVDVLKKIRYGNFTYAFPKLDSTKKYIIRLQFVADNTDSGKRVGNIYINDSLVLDSLDIFKETKVQYQLLVKQFTFSPVKDTIKIRFKSLIDNICVSAIQIEEVLIPKQIVAIDCGSGKATGSFTADQYGTGGNGWSLTAFHSGYHADTVGVANSAPADVYTTGAYGADIIYNIPALTANAEYTVRLHFADDYTQAGKRIEHVLINGDTILKNYDIFASVGQMKADVKDFQAKANDKGVIKIEFIKVVDNAWVCGIEILGIPAACTGQTIAMTAISKKMTTAADFVLKATDTSGLKIVYAIVSGPASIVKDSIVHLTGTAGTVVVSANQAGDATYCPAPEVTSSFYVSDNISLVYAIDCGGSGESEYEADNYFTGGNSWTWADALTTGITDPAPVDVLKKVRYGNFTYAFPNLNSSKKYTVRLHFVDASTALIQRTMNVYINDTMKLNKFDIYSVAQKQYQCVVKEFVVFPKNDSIKIKFEKIIDNACVNAIEIINTTPAGIQNTNKSITASVYPNPFTIGQLTITLNNNNEKMNMLVTDLLGKVIFSSIINTNQSVINLNRSLFESGLYFISIRNNKTTLNYKLIVQ